MAKYLLLKDYRGAPTPVTDGPFAEIEDLVAGCKVIDVDT